MSDEPKKPDEGSSLATCMVILLVFLFAMAIGVLLLRPSGIIKVGTTFEKPVATA
jgi:hypothetical protein